MRRSLVLVSILALGAAALAAELAEGYSWHRSAALHGSFAVPAGWSVEERVEAPWSYLVLAAGEGDSTTLEVRYAEDCEATIGEPPSTFARSFMDADFDRFKPLAGSSGTEGDEAWFEYTVHKEAEGLNRIARVRILANDADDRLYLLIFETAPSRWNRDKSTSEVLLRTYRLDEGE